MQEVTNMTEEEFAAFYYAQKKGVEFKGPDVYKTTGKRKKLSKFMASYHRNKVRELLTTSQTPNN